MESGNPQFIFIVGPHQPMVKLLVINLLVLIQIKYYHIMRSPLSQKYCIH